MNPPDPLHALSSHLPLPEALRGLSQLLLHGRGLASVQTLPALLAPLPLAPARQRWSDDVSSAVLAWGRKPSAQRAMDWAAARGLPVRWIEDGFLRSIGLGHVEPPLSVVVDDLGIYYDATRASRLEHLIAEPLTLGEMQRSAALRSAWKEARASKYNHAREARGLVCNGDILVVDQTAGDASIVYGMADSASFQRMLTAALDEHPHARILLKTHPDVLAGRKRGHFDRLSAGAAGRVTLVATDAHAPSLLEPAAAVYTVTSQMGFEALLWDKSVRCFGMPFYAGWGLTGDELQAPVRRRQASVDALLHAALLRYSRCLDPETLQVCEAERLLDWVALQRRMRERFPPQVVAIGFSRWKKPIVRAFFAGSEVRFAGPMQALPAGSALALWGRRKLPPAAVRQPPVQTIRLEDGFLRSVGLGADLVRPMSWVQDSRGMYYDAAEPSALELLLERTEFPAALVERAQKLRERITALGLTKYNVGQMPWRRPAVGKPVVLVVGQVESDAAVAHGAPGVRTNIGLLRAVRERLPDAHLVYKPHPDVVAQVRASGRGEGRASHHCDEVVTDASIDQVLREVDEVHVLTSLAGFEALLRQKPVVTWGLPFYSHWGLTTDLQPLPRRTRRLALDELVAGVLILYPTYLSRMTGKFSSPEQVLEELCTWRTSGPGTATFQRRVWRLAVRWARSLRDALQQVDGPSGGEK